MAPLLLAVHLNQCSTVIISFCDQVMLFQTISLVTIHIRDEGILNKGFNLFVT